jgi:hypothetical protein
LELTIFLLQHSECWDYGHVPPCLARLSIRSLSCVGPVQSQGSL